MTENGQRHLIKKYANRKLYDTNTRRYITLSGISDLVRRGSEIEVVERDSGRDLTPIILSQIVTTEEKRQAPVPDSAQRGQALLDYVRRTLNLPAALVSSEVERRVGDAEAVIDIAIDRALAQLNIPSHRDIQRLSRRLDALSTRVDALQPRRRGRKPEGEASPASRRRKAAPAPRTQS